VNQNLNLNMQSQLQSEWCWSAVAVSVSHFYNSASSWIQCDVVNQEFGQTTCCQNGATRQRNQPWYLDATLRRTGNLDHVSSGKREEINACMDSLGGDGILMDPNVCTNHAAGSFGLASTPAQPFSVTWNPPCSPVCTLRDS
jgi:hypothetical protein